ncbi:conserved hypothetical protein [Leishmania mexicana MHOM/GT/2001/U1103]|uniref:Uncharacterized protein n=1 Tax=Leishmania mexicana (strain MHOM/GT/2001/U1103) TaxID=929439 RepID=E9AZY9_LEIMU|nr:conserved hypothetical protein [Leishmania mexicana MHOM/GT/2001/U1103]CBZ28540.1 conserved hypothetical protein [Leishmania mexicana MHOM/GT/2001/U1103]
MSQPVRPAPLSVPTPATTKVAIPPSQPRPRLSGLPPGAALVKTALGVPPATMSRPHSTTAEISPLHSLPASKAASSPKQPPPLPSVPANSWYAQPLVERPGTPMSTFHRDHRGKIIFSPRPVPVEEAELLALPGREPQTLTVCEVGKDLLYGMAYLYAVPLAIEHQWRGRVAYLQQVRRHQAPIPDIVLRSVQGRTALQREQQTQGCRKASVPLSSSLPTSPAPGASAVTPVEYSNTMRFERGEAAVYDRPADDLLIGIKVFVNEALVEDHYPDVHALPQCTATIIAKEAAQLWSCVPFVLIGYLNQVLLDPISLFHTLSLNFVEHLLRVKLPGRRPTGPVEECAKATSTLPSSSAAAPSRPTKAAPLELPLRVEVVYGCRTEAFYCTEFISRGRCVLRMTETSKPSLKSYEEKLRALVKARHTAPQLIPRPTSGLPPPRVCVGCGYPLQFRCSFCGAEVCGSSICALSAVIGYPCACTRHVLQR